MEAADPHTARPAASAVASVSQCLHFFFEREHELTRSQQNAAPTAAAMRPARNSPSPPSLRILPTWATSPSMRLKATSKTFSSIVTSRVCALLRISWIASPRGLDTLSLVLWKA